MPSMEKDEIEAAVLHAVEVSLEAQLKAVRRLRAGPREPKAARKGTSQIDMVHDVLRRAGKPHYLSDAGCSGPMGSGLERRLQDVLALPLEAGAIVRPGDR